MKHEPGAIILLRGPNGSGKTSLLRALAGLESPLFEDEAQNRPAADLTRLVRFCPQHARDGFAGLTVDGEYRMRGLPMRGDDREVVTLSSGEARRLLLDLARAEVPLLLLDEPAEGLDAHAEETLRTQALAHAKGGGMVVAAEHGSTLDAIATRIVCLGSRERSPHPELPSIPPPPSGAHSIILETTAIEARGRRLPKLSLTAGFHAVIGPNGCGKSTLLLHSAGLLQGSTPKPGVRLALPDARRCLTRASVADELHGCEDIGLVPESLLPRHPLTLSGGEAQRVLLTKVLGREADVYLLDEPEAHLDAEARAQLVEAIARRVARGRCVVAATHDRELAQRAHTVVAL
ncbi:MAG: ATP-binding cassette domain-containing protein [Thermoplasmatota archaeon]